MVIAGILLAAGESRRMGAPKPLLKIGNETYLARLCGAMLTAAPRLYVVLGARAERIAEALPRDARIVRVDNPNFSRGQLSSLKVGLAALDASVAAAMVHLVDHPLVSAGVFQQIVAAYERNRSPIVIARYQGRRGHPVIFDRAVFDELRVAPEEAGARVVVDAAAEQVCYVDVDDRGILVDLDTPEDVVREGLPIPPAK